MKLCRFKALSKAQASARLHNIDEKGCRLAYPGGQDIVVPLEVQEIYIGIPENRLSVTVIETIRANRQCLTPLVVIMPTKKIIEYWYTDKMTGYELIELSESGYTNKAINIAWL